MSTANINGYMLRVKNDLSQNPKGITAATTVSASASAPSHHRLTPYFERPRRRQYLLVEFESVHPAPGDVQYVDNADPTVPPQADWTGDMEVASHRTKKSGPLTAKQLKVDPAPPSDLDRQIDCNFRVVARRSHQTQQWIDHPVEMQHQAGCTVTYKIQP